jgi:hypothetical protein
MRSRNSGNIDACRWNVLLPIPTTMHASLIVSPRSIASMRSCSISGVIADGRPGARLCGAWSTATCTAISAAASSKGYDIGIVVGARRLRLRGSGVRWVQTPFDRLPGCLAALKRAAPGTDRTSTPSQRPASLDKLPLLGRNRLLLLDELRFHSLLDLGQAHEDSVADTLEAVEKSRLARASAAPPLCAFRSSPSTGPFGDCLPERRTGAEPRRPRRLYLDRLTSSRIASTTCWALNNVELAEPGNRNLLSALQGTLDRLEHRRQDLAGIGLAQAGALCYVIHQL